MPDSGLARNPDGIQTEDIEAVSRSRTGSARIGSYARFRPFRFR